jgi:hypothetical protein
MVAQYRPCAARIGRANRSSRHISGVRPSNCVWPVRSSAFGIGPSLREVGSRPPTSRVIGTSTRLTTAHPVASTTATTALIAQPWQNGANGVADSCRSAKTTVLRGCGSSLCRFCILTERADIRLRRSMRWRTESRMILENPATQLLGQSLETR